MTHVPYQITHELRDIRSHVLNRVKRRIRAERGSVRSLSDARKPEVTFFAVLGCGFAQSLGKIDSEREKYHSNTTLLASRHNKREKASLLSPV